MICTLNYKRTFDDAIKFILDKLPNHVKDGLISFLMKKSIFIVNEIRIKANAYISLIVNQKNIITDVLVNQDVIDEIVLLLCNGSIYAHLPTIREGYINVGKGLRAGICGKAIIDNGAITGVYNITSINIRIPQLIKNAGKFVFELLKENQFSTSLLIYSPPGVGKTTILRDLVVLLSNANIRHAVIDSREEITPFLNGKICSDIFLTYPKGKAIEIATKSMTPQIIICDEIASLEDASAIHLSANTGVSIVATTHAKDQNELKSKEILKGLFRSNVFQYSIGVKRSLNNNYEYDIHTLE